MVQKVQLLKDELAISEIVIGSWRWFDLSDNQTLRLTETALEVGITTIDHADIYGNYRCEEIFGRAVPASLRDKLEIVSKCGIRLLSNQRPEHRLKHYDTSKAHIIASAERSLKNLKTDRLDLLLLHRPDPLLQADEVAEAFHELRNAGKVLHFGVSNYSASQFELLNSRIQLVTNQIELSLLHREPLHNGQLDQAQQLRYRPMVYSALGGGKLKENTTVYPLLERLARTHAVSPEAIALAWLLYLPAGVVPVIGTTKAERITEAAKAVNVKLHKQEWFELYEAVLGKPVP